MKSRLWLLFVPLMSGLASAGWAHHAPETPVLIQAEGARKDAVPFDHTKHFATKPDLQTNCNRCHHQVEDTNATRDEAPWKCTECHTVDGKDDAIPVKDAMHDREKGVCRDCHFGGDAEKRLRCNDCHTGGS